jgi:hypothetical protein
MVSAYDIYSKRFLPGDGRIQEIELLPVASKLNRRLGAVGLLVADHPRLAGWFNYYTISHMMFP